MCHSAFDQVMIQAPKEIFDVQINDPICAPASLSRHRHRVDRRAARSIAVRVGVKHRFHLRLGTIFTTVCATRSPTVGMPSGRVPPLSFDISTSRTGGGKYEPDDIRFQILKRFPFSPSRLPPSLHPRYRASSLQRTRPSLRLALVLGSSWVHHLEFSLRIEAGGPTFHTRACTGLTPPSCRSPLGQSAGTSRACPRPATRAWFRWRPWAFDMSSAVHFRSSSQHSPNGVCPVFPVSLTTPAIGPEQHPVVWTLALQPESEGPTLISVQHGYLKLMSTSQPPPSAFVAHSRMPTLRGSE
jgi:hypothetical protein